MGPEPVYVDLEQRLEGSVNDINDIESWLRQKYDPINITAFLAAKTGDPAQTEPPGSPNSWPTYENITQKLRDITLEAYSGDLIYVHYSGHGKLKPTVAGEYQESDRSDAALVLYDVKEKIRYLRGIELASIFDVMVQKGLKLTMALDCCHAGAISRNPLSMYVHVRGIKWDPFTAAKNPVTTSRTAHISVSMNSLYRDGDRKQHWLLNPDGYILFAGCGPREIAGECRGEDNKVHGAMSYLLLSTSCQAPCFFSTTESFDAWKCVGIFFKCAISEGTEGIRRGNRPSIILQRGRIARPTYSGVQLDAFLTHLTFYVPKKNVQKFDYHVLKASTVPRVLISQC